MSDDSQLFSVFAPGKLMLSGEWSVLELSHPCVVAAVNVGITVSCYESDVFSVTSEAISVADARYAFDGELTLESDLSSEQIEKMLFIESALKVGLSYFSAVYKMVRPVRLVYSTSIPQFEVNGERHKVGFGSSASVVVATIGVLAQKYGLDLTSFEDLKVIFKLASISHYVAQGKIGSSFDIAASVFGGLLYFKRFDPDWLAKELLRKSIFEVVELRWPFLEIESIPIPKDLRLTVGYSGTQASTKALVTVMNHFKQRSPDVYNRIVVNIAEVTEQLVFALRESDSVGVIRMINENRRLLLRLSRESGVELENEQLQKLADLAIECGGAGKFSGAGGGDSGIGVCFSDDVERCIIEHWKQDLIRILDVSISEKGLDLR